MNLTIETRVGKRYAIYLPKIVVKTLGMKEGDRVLLRVSGERIILEILRDPIELALHGNKFASIKPGEIEAISVEEQANQAKNTP
ncbi:MAG: AbrB/MazE/SpoVT family DNA-binding domain-containing protein [Thermoproteota archaeon]